MKILLAGTPNFTILTFTKIIENFDVVGIISQPNRPIGRKKIVMDTPTAMLAKFYKIPIFQPEKLIDIYDQLKQIDFDVLITMAYGQIIPEKILKLAKKGSFNIHGSLLPKYRGASPIQYSLLNGDNETGITFMEMNSKMDEGDILFQEKLPILENDNFDSLMKKMSLLSSEKIVEWLNKIKKDDYIKIKQDAKLATYSKKIMREDEKIVFDTIEKTLNKIRALSSNPGAYMIINNDQPEFKNLINRRVKIFEAIKEYKPGSIEIKCVDGSLFAIDYQLEGKLRKKIEL